MPYNFVSDGFHTKKRCSRLSSKEINAILDGTLPFCVSEPPGA